MRLSVAKNSTGFQPVVVLDSYLRVLTQEYFNTGSGGQEVADALNGPISFVVGGFQFAVGGWAASGW
jgi:hypothetical protein